MSDEFEDDEYEDDEADLAEIAAQQEAAKRAEWLNGVRSLADFIEANPDFGVPYGGFTQYLYAGDSDETKSALAAMARMLGTAAKETSDFYFQLTRMFGPIPFTVAVDREMVCRKVVTGVETVEVQVPPEGVEMVTVTEQRETFEWICPESILRPAESAVA